MLLITLFIIIQHSIALCDCSTFTTLNSCNTYQTCYWNGFECIQPPCSKINNQTKCLEPQCTWIEDTCNQHTTCNYIMNRFECNNVFGCIYNDGFCLPYQTCSFTSKETCTGITASGIQCFWNDGSNGENDEGCFVFESCNRLDLKNCESVPYCAQVHDVCKNKSEIECSDIKEESECQDMQNYQCIWTGEDCIYHGCENYLTSQVNCVTHGCTWTGSSCEYCDLNPLQAELLYVVSIFLYIMVN